MDELIINIDLPGIHEDSGEEENWQILMNLLTFGQSKEFFWRPNYFIECSEKINEK